jgi:hypothetical protein
MFSPEGEIMRIGTIAAFGAALCLGVGLGSVASAQDRTVTIHQDFESYYPTAEVGIQAGEPTGLSGKYWFSPWSALDMGLTWRFPKDGYSFNADYVAHSYVLRNSGNEPAGAKIPLYAGAGVKALRLSSDKPVLGARFPIGVDALLEAIPVSVFAEVAPGAVFEHEGPKFSADAGVGARVYF